MPHPIPAMSRRRRAHDERGFAVPVVVMVITVGFVLSIMIASTTLGSVRQTTHGRSNVQALAAAEAGRDTIAAALSLEAPYCPTTTGTVDSGTWSTNLFVRSGTSVPSGTTYTADGTPQGTGWSATTCAGLATAAPGDYTVVLASTGTATDGTVKVIDAVYPFTIEPPNTSIVATQRGPFTLKGALGGNGGNAAYTGDLVITGPDNATNFTCGDGSEITVIDGDVYVLNGNARFRWPGCFITGDLYVAGNATVRGNDAGVSVTGVPPTLEFPYDHHERILWVKGDVRVGGNLEEEDGMTVKGSILAGGNVSLQCGGGSLRQVQVGTGPDPAPVAILAGGNVTLRDLNGISCGGTDNRIIGDVQAVGSVDAHDNYWPWSTSGNPNWRIAGRVQSGTSALAEGVDTDGVWALQNVRVDGDSRVFGPVTAGGEARLNDSTAGPVTAGGNVNLSNSSAGRVASGGNITSSGGGTISGTARATGSVQLTLNVTENVRANGPISISNAAKISGDLSTSSSATNAVVLTDAAEVNGTVTTPGSASASGVQWIMVNNDEHAMLGKAGVNVGGSVTLSLASAGPITAGGKVTSWSRKTSRVEGDIVTSTASPTAVDLEMTTVKGLVAANTAVTLKLGARVEQDVWTSSTANPAVSVVDARVVGGVTTKGGVSSTNSTIVGSVSSGSTVTVDGSATGAVHATGAVTAQGPTTITGDLISGGNVKMSGAKVTGNVRANGDFTGSSTGGEGVAGGDVLSVGKSVWASGHVSIRERSGFKDESIGDGTGPAIWAGRTVSLLRDGDNSSSVAGLGDVGQVQGEVRVYNSDNASTPVTVQRRWIVVDSQIKQRTGGTGNIEDCDRFWGGCVAGWPSPKINKKQVKFGSGSDSLATVKAQVITDPTIGAPTGITTPPVPTVNAVTTTAPVVAEVTAPDPLPTAETVPTVPPLEEIMTVPGEGSNPPVVLDEGHWMDLGYEQVKAAAVQSGYTQTTFNGESLTFSAADCTNGGLFGWGWSPAVRRLAAALGATGNKYLVDATACSDAFDFKIQLPLDVNSDAVILLKNYTHSLTSNWLGNTTGTAASPRKLFFIQPDSQPDHAPTCNNANAPGNVRPEEQSGREKFKLDSAYGNQRISTMYYMPCGQTGVITGSAASSRIFGQVLSGAPSSWIWNEMHCRPMALGAPRALFDLRCDRPQSGDDVINGGGASTYRLGELQFQAEP